MLFVACWLLFGVCCVPFVGVLRAVLLLLLCVLSAVCCELSGACCVCCVLSGVVGGM